MPTRAALVLVSNLLALVAVLLPEPRPLHAQIQAPAQTQMPPQNASCSCACPQAPAPDPALAASGSDGLCPCPCEAADPIPGINVETLAGPPKPPKAGGPEPTWTVEPFADDDFGDPFWGGWW